MMRFTSFMVVAAVVVLGVLPVAAIPGVSVKLEPSTVRPGELFELRVEMHREKFSRFELAIPGHENLHRVAVETSPLSLQDGFYHQGETWVLQADSSGSILIDGAKIRLETADGIEIMELPAMVLEVLPYTEEDQSSEPLEFPAPIESGASNGSQEWWWLLGGGVVGSVLLWWLNYSRRESEEATPKQPDLREEFFVSLEAGRIDRARLERLIEEEGGSWSQGLRSRAERAVYGKAMPESELLEWLKKEVEQ